MKRHLNLMSPQARRSSVVRRARRRWACVLAVVFLALLPFGATRGWRYYRVERRRAAACAEYDPIRQLRAENSRMREQIKALESSQRLLLSLAENKPVVALLGTAAEAVAEQGGAVYLKQLELEQGSLTGDQSTDSALALEGDARNTRAVEQFVELLKSRGPFRNVDFSANETSDESGQRLYHFTVECLY